MEDEIAEWRPLVPFVDPSPSFVHGFEAGMIWQRIDAGESVIEGTAHTENVEVIRRMCAARGYDVTSGHSGVEGWVYYKLTKRRSHLQLVSS